MLKKILIVLAVLVVALVALVSTRPGTFKVERTLQIRATPDIVFGFVNDFHQWAAWSPWDKLDPAMKKTFEGPPSGLGASQAWEGNDKVGTGKQTITESKPNELVEMRLEFLKPYQATNKAYFQLKPEGAATNVTWGVAGDLNFMMKAMGLFMNMDEMIGKDFEKGLEGLKKVSEEEAKNRVAAAHAAAAAAAAAAAPAPAGTLPAPGTPGAPPPPLKK